MGKFKIIIFLLLFIGVVGFIFYQREQINSLRLEVATKEQTIQLQDNKIKELLSEINLLKADNETKNKSIESLQQRNNTISLNNEQLMHNLMDISEILPEEMCVGMDVKIEENKTTVIQQGVTSEENGKKFIQVRNRIYSSYQ